MKNNLFIRTQVDYRRSKRKNIAAGQMWSKMSKTGNWNTFLLPGESILGLLWQWSDPRILISEHHGFSSQQQGQPAYGVPTVKEKCIFGDNCSQSFTTLRGIEDGSIGSHKASHSLDWNPHVTVPIPTPIPILISLIYLYFQLLKGKAEVKAEVQYVKGRFGRFGWGLFQWTNSSKPNIWSNGKTSIDDISLRDEHWKRVTRDDGFKNGLNYLVIWWPWNRNQRDG